MTDLESRLAELERRLQATIDQAQRLEIALDETRTDLRRLRHQVRTGESPEQSMVGLAPLPADWATRAASQCSFCAEPCQFCSPDASPRPSD